MPHRSEPGPVDLDPERTARAATALAEGVTVERAPGGEYRVGSFTRPDVTYTVDLDRRECSCPDAAYRGRTCKHLAAVALLRGLRED